MSKFFYSLISGLFISTLIHAAEAPGSANTKGSLVAISTHQFSLQQHEGKVLLLDFWASWCGPCRRSFPWMNEVQQKYAKDGLIVIAVNLDKDRADAADFLQSYPAEFQIIYDPEGTIARSYEVTTMPTSFVIDRSGKVLGQHRGFLNKQSKRYEQHIVDALAIPYSENNKSTKKQTTGELAP